MGSKAKRTARSRAGKSRPSKAPRRKGAAASGAKAKRASQKAAVRGRSAAKGPKTPGWKGRLGALADKARAVARDALDRIRAAGGPPADKARRVAHNALKRIERIRGAGGSVAGGKDPRRTGAARALPSDAAATPVFRSPIANELIEEPLFDASGVLRVTEKLAARQRDVDEDARKRFPDPSLVIEAEAKRNADKVRRRSKSESTGRLPSLFEEEARRQRERRETGLTSGVSKVDDGSLFGSIKPSGPNESGRRPTSNADPDDPDE